jgi:short-subunit dehydrogenase
LKSAPPGYRALMRGDPVIVTGFANKLGALSVRFTPRRMAAAIAARLMEK